jgi:hypothetical protein
MEKAAGVAAFFVLRSPGEAQRNPGFTSDTSTA